MGDSVHVNNTSYQRKAVPLVAWTTTRVRMLLLCEQITAHEVEELCSCVAPPCVAELCVCMRLVPGH
jgi:hypothetical protein